MNLLAQFCKWADSHYRGLMLSYMAIELLLLAYIAWKA